MNEDRIEGSARTIGGKVQEAAGRLTGDAKTRVEGEVNEAAGRAQDLYGQARDAAADAVGVHRGRRRNDRRCCSRLR